jgi:hypothetical protein
MKADDFDRCAAVMVASDAPVTWAPELDVADISEGAACSGSLCLE